MALAQAYQVVDVCLCTAEATAELDQLDVGMVCVKNLTQNYGRWTGRWGYGDFLWTQYPQIGKILEARTAALMTERGLQPSLHSAGMEASRPASHSAARGGGSRRVDRNKSAAGSSEGKEEKGAGATTHTAAKAKADTDNHLATADAAADVNNPIPDAKTAKPKAQAMLTPSADPEILGVVEEPEGLRGRGPGGRAEAGPTGAGGAPLGADENDEADALALDFASSGGNSMVRHQPRSSDMHWIQIEDFVEIFNRAYVLNDIFAHAHGQEDIYQVPCKLPPFSFLLSSFPFFVSCVFS